MDGYSFKFFEENKLFQEKESFPATSRKKNADSQKKHASTGSSSKPFLQLCPYICKR